MHLVRIRRVARAGFYYDAASPPKETGGEIHGLKVHESLATIDEPVYLVQVFLASAALPGIARSIVGKP